MGSGVAYLVGAGPGDPELLTVKAVRCLTSADVALYDDLVHPSILDHLGPDCERIYVGKRLGFQAMKQEETTALLVEKVRKGHRVVRLKGGDPFVFGRGGEEAEALQEAGLAFEIVPGITSGFAAPAYAGIPVTHRGKAAQVTLVTGHEDPTKAESQVDWDALGRAGGTIVVYMGVSKRAQYAQKLIESGRSPDTPVAAIQWGTRSEQRSVRGTLATLADLAIENPSAIVIGEVAGMDLAWFEKRPLAGKTVAVTRTREQASDLVVQLRDLGAEVVEIPTIQIVDPEDWGPVDTAIDGLDGYDWAVFASPNGVSKFMERVRSKGRDARAFGGCRIACVGPATGKKLEAYGLRPDLTPDDHISEGIVEAFERLGSVEGLRVLVPRPEIAREKTSTRLREMGASVDDVVAYRTVKPAEIPHVALDRLESGSVDLVTFTSSSTARHFAELLSEELLERVRREVVAASIGPTTTRTATELGFRVVTEPAASDVGIPGLVSAILSYFTTT